MLKKSHFNIDETLLTPLNSKDHQQQVNGFNSDKLQRSLEDQLDQTKQTIVINYSELLQAPISNLAGCNNDINKSEKTTETFTANVLQNQAKYQDSVAELQSFNENILPVDEGNQTLNNSLTSVDKELNNQRKATSTPLTYTVHPYYETPGRSSKSNLKVLNADAEPAVHFPNGCKNLAQFEQRVRFAMEQEMMDKIKRKKHHFYRAYCERRVDLGISNVADPVSGEIFQELRSDVKKSKFDISFERELAQFELLSNQPEFEIYEDASQDVSDYEYNGLKKGLAKFEFPEQRTSEQSAHQAEILNRWCFCFW